MKKLFALVLASAISAVAVSGALAGDKAAKCCAVSKGKKVCTMDADQLKQCPMSDKQVSKDDPVMYVCPMKDFASTKPGKCPNCGMDLKKMYCHMDSKNMKTGAKCPYMSGKMGDKADEAKDGAKKMDAEKK